MPTSFTSTYLLPAVLLNPIVILHGINTFWSHMIPSVIATSTSQHQWLERLGPSAASEPYFNVHNNDQMCWGYTAILVIVQILAYGRVRNNRVKRKSARAAKMEQEKVARISREALDSKTVSRQTSTGPIFEIAGPHDVPMNGSTRKFVNGQISLSDPVNLGLNDGPEKYQGGINTPEISSEEETIA
jgi:hypothetical protein